MSVVNSAVYDALRNASGVSEEKACKAAEAVARIGERFDKIVSEMLLLKWMIVALYPMIIIIFVKILVQT